MEEDQELRREAEGQDEPHPTSTTTAGTSRPEPAAGASTTIAGDHPMDTTREAIDVPTITPYTAAAGGVSAEPIIPTGGTHQGEYPGMCRLTSCKLKHVYCSVALCTATSKLLNWFWVSLGRQVSTLLPEAPQLLLTTS
jgi:hypothetical protein